MKASVARAPLKRTNMGMGRGKELKYIVSGGVQDLFLSDDAAVEKN